MSKRVSVIIRLMCFVILCIAVGANAFAQHQLNYYASFDDAKNHYINVELQLDNLQQDTTALVLPVWTPGYYKILDSPKHIVDFQVYDKNKTHVPWYKTSKNTWVIAHKELQNLTVSYKVFANRKSVAESLVNAEKAFVMPNNVFMFIEGNMDNPITLHIKKHPDWHHVSTGLKPINATTFYAENIDILYDSPIYIGNQKVIDFKHDNRDYSLAIVTPEGLNEDNFVTDLRKIITATTNIMKHVPYKNYCFIMMEEGGGGLEHWNSQAVFTNGSFLFNSGKSYTDFLNFIAHEYFHLYNVKAIRPIELGPFDYSKENYTDMLWVSEGLTVYYEYIIMLRAGLLDGQAALDYLGTSMGRYENFEGKKHMSLSQSSFDIWLNFFNSDLNAKDVTISYYNKGPVIGLLLDLEIRHLTQNTKSLDDVMRNLYNTYYLKKQRGFKKEEFWAECQMVAGQPLQQLQVYVNSVQEIDYNKYLNYAGLELKVEAAKEEGRQDTFKFVPTSKPTKAQLAIRKDLFKF